jgi:hypothetical protein
MGNARFLFLFSHEQYFQQWNVKIVREKFECAKPFTGMILLCVETCTFQVSHKFCSVEDMESHGPIKEDPAMLYLDSWLPSNQTFTQLDWLQFDVSDDAEVKGQRHPLSLRSNLL